LSWGAAFLKIAFGFKGFKFFLHLGTPLHFLAFFPAPPYSGFKLSLFFARAYNSFGLVYFVQRSTKYDVAGSRQDAAFL